MAFDMPFGRPAGTIFELFFGGFEEASVSDNHSRHLHVSGHWFEQKKLDNNKKVITFEGSI